ncbi:hypothetical protein R3X27_15915 [Tropicimonas sp. TH_r6]|uniref:hypothetical protein n=1 Tax=Tropicimonas sp. TH_r6 TaxID=3082085 RepID=UPI00295358AE|nr:hypothetical protein [Tropicimonas sp. TH_r6]MDV7144172.1 hypothetical protein [Tropicimonas sp. TH_r6]
MIGRRISLALLLVVGTCASAFAQSDTAPTMLDPIEVTQDTPNETCWDCHGVEGFATPDGATAHSMRALSLQPQGFELSSHGRQQCVACHTDIAQVPHKPDLERKVDCVQCHEETAAGTRPMSLPEGETADMELVVEQIRHYLESKHAEPSKDDPSRPNATCIDCHNAHYTYPVGDKAGQTFRLNTPQTCGNCHDKQLGEYHDSVHGVAVSRFESTEAAVCSDCHTAHAITSTEADPMKVLITENCGSCHEESYRTYTKTYHGQVSQLGYAHTAKCFDCHAPHSTRALDDPRSMSHDDNRLKTCQACHKNAPEGFELFHPHGNANDFENYPYMFIVSKFMIALLAGVFAFFWSHSLLWFYREWVEMRAARKAGTAATPHVRVDTDGAPAFVQAAAAEGRTHVRRFSPLWRTAHLLFAVAIMILVLTGTAVLYADSFWAPHVIRALGGPQTAAIIHRVAAVTFAVVFFGHIFVTIWTLIKNRKTFRWFGPTSLLPNWQDLKDAYMMFRWFFGFGPKPAFDHWTYYEKFDYWAPFWGMVIIGLSGAMLWFPEQVAHYLPGWVFNIATIVHGEEAFLAAVFLFTVHYFNCHFRPEKAPQDISIFTGTVPLDEFKHERAAEYERLVESGELDDVLVAPPSARMTLGSQILGAVLIVIGLVLLFFVLSGFWTHLVAH